MLIGAGIFATDYAIRPDHLARELEQRGFESLWLPEHTHIPVSRRSPFAGGGELPEQYWHTHDPFVALTAAAIATTRLRLATGICLIIQRDPITTAKAVASLDMLSGGRFIFGIGGGWNAEEMENHGTDFKRRWRLLRERILAMKEIWTKDEAEYHGELVRFDKIWSYPKPVRSLTPDSDGRQRRRHLRQGDRILRWLDSARIPGPGGRRCEDCGASSSSGGCRPQSEVYPGDRVRRQAGASGRGWPEAGGRRQSRVHPAACRARRRASPLDQYAALIGS